MMVDVNEKNEKRAFRVDGHAAIASRQGKLTPNNPAFAALHPGAGPRHLVLHPSERALRLCVE